eukprot:g11133.t1
MGYAGVGGVCRWWDGDEDSHGPPELTAEKGQGHGPLVSELKHAEAQLRRVVADARRAEQTVRREVGRVLADARAYLEDTGHQQQEFWAARQRAHVAECLTKRVDSLEMTFGARLEANERGFDSVQASLENLESQRMDDLVGELEQKVLKKALSEIRGELAAAVNSEAQKLRQDAQRQRSDEVYCQSLRLHALEERFSVLDQPSAVGCGARSEGHEADQEGPGKETLGGLTPRNESNSEVRSEMLKMKKELEEFFRRKSDASAADLADLDQRFTLVEERLRLYDEKMPGAARGATEVAEASLCQLEDVLQEVDVMKRCLEELAQRFGQEGGKGPEPPRSFRLNSQAKSAVSQAGWQGGGWRHESKKHLVR